MKKGGLPLLFLALLTPLIIGAGVICWRIFRDYEAATRAQDRRLFDIQKKERAVEIERELRRKREEKKAREIRRIASGYTRLHKEFPSYAPTSEKYQAYNRVMAEVREKKKGEEDEDDLGFLRGQ